MTERLRQGAGIAEPVALVAAQPDDETVGLGSRLSTFGFFRLIHVTDGAPLSRNAYESAGFSTREAYADAREEELVRALAAVGAGPECIRYEVPDQQAIFQLRTIVERLTRDLAGMSAVITHPYEAGHPDHDATVLAVALACRRIGRKAPLRLEFASYYLGDQGPVFARFRASPGCTETELPQCWTAIRSDHG